MRKDLKARGVLARKQQRAKNKLIIELDKAKQPIPDELLVRVPDPELDPLELVRIKEVQDQWEKER
jgi:hypothetical protein